jgi:hypothetical protein
MIADCYLYVMLMWAANSRPETARGAGRLFPADERASFRPAGAEEEGLAPHAIK